VVAHFDIIRAMKSIRYEVTLEKIERIRVIVDATDRVAARLLALEKERRGEADSVEDRVISVADITCVG